MPKPTLLLKLIIFALASITAKISYADNCADSLQGKRLVIEGAEYAEIAFKDKETLIFYTELTGDIPLFEARIRWISEDILYAIENGRNCNECSPRTWLFEIKASQKDGTILLHEFNNTWPAFDDNTFTYKISAM